MAMVISEKKLWLLPSPPLPLLRGSPFPSSASTVSVQQQKRKLRRICLSVSCKMVHNSRLLSLSLSLTIQLFFCFLFMHLFFLCFNFLVMRVKPLCLSFDFYPKTFSLPFLSVFFLLPFKNLSCLLLSCLVIPFSLTFFVLFPDNSGFQPSMQILLLYMYRNLDKENENEEQFEHFNSVKSAKICSFSLNP